MERNDMEARPLFAPPEMAEVITVTVANRHEPKIFYQNRRDLMVGINFLTHILSRAQPTDAGRVIKAKGEVLFYNLTDAQLKSFLPAGHFFDETTACVLVAELITKQSGRGEVKFPLSMHGDSNIFLLETNYIHVRIIPGGVCEWYVDFEPLRPNAEWGAGDRVFYPVE